MIENLTPAAAAALLVAGLEARGATFVITRDGYLHADLDAVLTDALRTSPDVIAKLVLSLPAEIKRIIRSRAVTH